MQEVIQHYLHHSSHPLVAVLDCSKDFDLAKWDTLFLRVLDREVPAVIVRALMFMCQEQYAWAKWGGKSLTGFQCLTARDKGAAVVLFCGRCIVILFLVVSESLELVVEWEDCTWDQFYIAMISS